MQKEQSSLPSLHEPHRNLVRQMHERVERTYAYGGLGAMAASMGCVALFAAFSTLASPLAWVAAIMCALVGLFIVRGRVKRAQDRARQDFKAYCALNQLDEAHVRDYFISDANYPFFSGLYETKLVLDAPSKPDAEES